MKPVIHLATRAAFASIAFTALPSTLMAADFVSQNCKAIHAEIVATQITQGCKSAVGLCTMGTIDGNLGLNGKTQFIGDSLDPNLATAPDAPATVAFSGVLRITTESGTLTLRDTGVFNTASDTPTGGFFASFDRIDGGTGRFAGATGSIFVGGKTIKGLLIAQITGELCLR